MASSATAVWMLEESPDPKLPVCRGRTPEEIRYYKQRAKGFVLGLPKQDRGGAGPRLMNNLREAAAEVFIGKDPSDYIDDDADLNENGLATAPATPNGTSRRLGAGWRKLLRELTEAFPRGTIRELPEKFDAFFELNRLRGAGHPDAMNTFLRGMERAKSELVAADPTTAISDGIMGYFALKLSGLSEEERRQVLQHTGRRYNYPAIKEQLLDLFPKGSRHSSTGSRSFHPPRGRHWARVAQLEVPYAYGEDDEAEDEAADEESEAMWNEAYEAGVWQAPTATIGTDSEPGWMAELEEQGQTEAYDDSQYAGESEEWSEAPWPAEVPVPDWGSWSASAEASVDSAADAEVGEGQDADSSRYRTALVTMRQARANFRQSRRSRGFTPGRGRSPSAGKGSKAGRQPVGAPHQAPQLAAPHYRCFDCGGLGHLKGDPSCPRPRPPGPGRKGGKPKGRGRGRGGKGGKGGKLKGLFASIMATVAAGMLMFPMPWSGGKVVPQATQTADDSDNSTTSEEIDISWMYDDNDFLELGSGPAAPQHCANGTGWWSRVSSYVALPARHVAYPAWKASDRPHLVVDTGANHGLGGSEWYEDVKRHLLEHGLRPLEREVTETYTGISDKPLKVWREAEVPLGINGMHTSAHFHLLDSDGSSLPGLACCPDLQRWDGVLHMRNNTMELRQLNGSVTMSNVDGQLCMPCCDFSEAQWDDPVLARFRAEPEAPQEAPQRKVFYASTPNSSVPKPIVADLIAQGRRGVMKRQVKLEVSEALRQLSAAVGRPRPDLHD